MTTIVVFLSLMVDSSAWLSKADEGPSSERVRVLRRPKVAFSPRRSSTSRE